MVNMNLTDYIAPCYYKVHKSVLNRDYDTFRLKGGRASLKSTFCATEATNLLLKYNWVCVAVFMKQHNRLREGAYNLYHEVIYRMGLQRYFHFSLNPMKITYKPTGQYILFLGLDDPFKTKGLSTGDPKTCFAVSHFEELDQFSGVGEIDTVLESLVRGCPFHWSFQCYNPPENRNNWCNRDSLKNIDGRLVYHTDYRMVPTDWLGEPFYRKMRQTRQRSEREYRWRYLGESTGTGGSVFENIRDITLTPEMIANFDNNFNGQDWGYFPDPCAFTRTYISPNGEDIYIFAERVKQKSTYAEEAKAIIDSGYNDVETILDSARGGEMLDAFASQGVLVRNMYKGHNGQLSRDFGIQWLQTRKNIYIDKNITPVSYEEFISYEYQKDLRTGEFINRVITFNDHTIDSVRYGTSPYYQTYGIGTA